ncbi:MAG: hypothetical protein K0S44_2089 [Bacteroidetes bacterium]|nr:hypothetical protein [Bacteroidota bacterium]
MIKAQNCQWAKRFGYNNSNEGGTAITMDRFGHLYQTGYIGIGLNYNIFLMKYDTLGNSIWYKTSAVSDNNSSRSIQTDSLGNIYIAGSFYGDSITFGSITLHNKGWSDIFITKYDSLGNVVWAKQIGGSDTDRLNDFHIDHNDNLILTGLFGDSLVFGNNIVVHPPGYSSSNFFIAKLDTYGNGVWAKTSSAIYEQAEGTAISSDSSGNIFVAGTFTSPGLTFGNIQLNNIDTTYSLTEIFIVKYNEQGNVIWAKAASGNSGDYCSDICVGPTNDLYLIGGFKSMNFSIDGFNVTNANNTGNTWDAFIAKFDDSGNVMWLKKEGGFNDDIGRCIEVDKNGSFHVFGGFTSAPLQFSGSITVTSGPLFYGQYDKFGNILWINGAGNGSGAGAGGMYSDGSKNIYLTGAFNGSGLGFYNGIGYTNVFSSGASFDDSFLTRIATSDEVWPGDANHDFIADNNDLLPIGLHYSQTGIPRPSIDNNWQAHPAVDWGYTEANGADIKHADCNGDGIIDSNDTLAILLNMNLAHAFIAHPQVVQPRSVADLYFVTGSNSYHGGDWVIAELWIGTPSLPVSELYGIAFDVKYNTDLVRSGTVNVSIPDSWLGTINMNALKLSNIDSSANIAYGAVVRTDHINANGYGKIAELKFQLKNSVTSLDTLNLSVSRYTAVKADGEPQIFNILPLVSPLLTNIENSEISFDVQIYPNPYSLSTQISYSLKERAFVSIEIFDALGQKKTTLCNENQLPGAHNYHFAPTHNKGGGIYFVKISIDGKSIMRKIVETK